MNASATLSRRRPRSGSRAGSPSIEGGRAALLFGVLALAFAMLAGRSIYLQWIDNAFLQERGAARYSRELELPAHRGRIVDRSGEPLAVSTPPSRTRVPRPSTRPSSSGSEFLTSGRSAASWNASTR